MVFFFGSLSVINYAGDASRTSNKGATNEEYLAEVNAHIDTFLIKYLYFNREEVPTEMVITSASGLDPYITPQCVYVQIQRVVKARNIKEMNVCKIVEDNIQRFFRSVWS